MKDHDVGMPSGDVGVARLDRNAIAAQTAPMVSICPPSLSDITEHLRSLRLAAGHDEAQIAGTTFAVERDLIAGYMERLWPGIFDRLDGDYGNPDAIAELEAILDIIADAYASDAARAMSDDCQATSRGRAAAYAAAAMLIACFIDCDAPSTRNYGSFDGAIRLHGLMVSVPMVIPSIQPVREFGRPGSPGQA
jgi:hypothetical protein